MSDPPPALTTRLITGTPGPHCPRLLVSIGDEARELTTEEALRFAEHLVTCARAMVASENDEE